MLDRISQFLSTPLGNFSHCSTFAGDKLGDVIDYRVKSIIRNLRSDNEYQFIIILQLFRVLVSSFVTILFHFPHISIFYWRIAQ